MDEVEANLLPKAMNEEDAKRYDYPGAKEKDHRRKKQIGADSRMSKEGSVRSLTHAHRMSTTAFSGSQPMVTVSPAR